MDFTYQPRAMRAALYFDRLRVSKIIDYSIYCAPPGGARQGA
jgi:hypothetical protein